MGIGELLIVLVVALIVIGPKKLPSLARTLGQYWQKLQNLSQHITQEIDEESKLQQLKRNIELAEKAEKSKEKS